MPRIKEVDKTNLKPAKARTRKGLKVKQRALAIKKPDKKLTGNQWQNTPQQNKFMECWLDPSSSTFGNAYRSAIAVGYSIHYAKVISAPETANKWIKEYLRATFMDGEHIRQGIQDVYRNPETYNNAKSPADTRLKALELLAKITGMLNQGNTTNVTLVQPILNGSSVRPSQRVIEHE